MNFQEIKQQIGKNLKIYSDANGWSTTTGAPDINETDIGNLVNEVYLGDIFTLIDKQYPHYYRHVGYADSWIADGVVDALSTSQTLVSTTSIFNNTMVGLWVWNEDLGEKTRITAYIDGSTVEVEETIGDTWDGDSIYVLGQTFTLGGDASDYYVIEDVGVKFNTQDQYFRLGGNPRPLFDLFQQGGEKFSEGSPQIYLTSVQVGNVFKDAIGILPEFGQKVERAVQIIYTARPQPLTGTDVPRVPTPEVLIDGGTWKAFLQQNKFQEAAIYQAMYIQKKREVIARFSPTSTSTARIPRMPRRYYNIFRRYS